MALAGEPIRSSDQELIHKTLDGDHEAFRLLMQRHVKQAYTMAYRFVRDHDSAEDVTQEVFVKVFGTLSSFRGDAEFGTWLYRIVVNTAISHRRLTQSTVQRQVRMRDIQNIPDNGFPDAIAVEEKRAAIEQALHDLPTLQRAVVILRHLNGLSTRQVSTILRCSEGTVKTHLFRGLKKLRRTLELQEKVL